MRILHTIPTVDPSSGGPVEGLKQFCNIYLVSGHDVEVASLDSPEFVRNCSFPVKVFALGPSWGTYRYSLHATSWLKANIASYDMVFINGIWNYNAVATYRALFETNIPYAVFTHGMLDPYFKRRFPLKHLKKLIYWKYVLYDILHNAAAVLFTCEEEMLLARQSFAKYQVRESVVPYGTFGPDCDTVVAAGEFLVKYPQLQGNRLAISLGRIHPKKGTDMLIQAFADTLANDPAWHLVIVGPDQIGWQKHLISLAVNLGIAKRITWTGMLTGALKWGAIAASEVFVLPSHQENFGIVVAEAMSCSVPVIISNKVNIWREIDSYSAGYVGEDTLRGTKDSFARWMALSSVEIAEMRIRSKICFDKLFDYHATSEQFLGILERITYSGR
jgi:glycosyltransferase involved in cell wall biosynthesis